MASKRVPTATDIPALDTPPPAPVVAPAVDPDADGVDLAQLDLVDQARLADVGQPPPDEVVTVFLRGQGADPATSAPPTGPDLWMLEPCSRGRRIAFLESLGARFGGDVPGITVYVLDRWSEQPMGFRFTLDPGALEIPVVTPRAEALLARCFVRTRTGLYKRAFAEQGGDLDAAIRASVHEMMDLFGLEASLGLAEETVHG